MTAPEPHVKDVLKYSYALSEAQLPAAQSRYDYLLQRRDQLNDRIRSGTLALNAASLLGVFTALSTDAIAKGEFGLSTTDLAFCAAAFIIGLIGGVVGIAFESYRIPEEASLQFDRLSRHQRHRAALESKLDDDGLKFARERMEDIHALPPADFKFSWPSLLATNFAGGAWIAGMLLPLGRIAELVAF